MNIFEFTLEIIKFASKNIINFSTSFLFLSLIGILFISAINTFFSRFKLHVNLNKDKKRNESNTQKINTVKNENKINDNLATDIYSILIKVWEKHKKSKDM